MIIEFWNTFLFQPLYNVLIFIYNNWTDENFGWAIIYLTIMLRVVLLPLTIISFINKQKNEQLHEEVNEMAKQFQHDPILQKQEVRRLLRQKRVSPWAAAVSLGIQAVVVVLLYEVFLFGLEGNRIIDYLYPWVEYPGNINTEFYGEDIGATQSTFWAGLVAGWIFLESFLSIRKDDKLEKKDLTFLFLFPLAIFLILWILPMMKALFFFTAMIFSSIVGMFMRVLFAGKKKKESGA